MLIAQSGDPTPLAIVIGARSEIDQAQKRVLENMFSLNHVLGANYVKRSLRVALRDYGGAVPKKIPFEELAGHRSDLHRLFAERGVKTVLTIGKVAFWCLHGRKVDLLKWIGAPRVLPSGISMLHAFAPWEMPGMFRPVLFRHLKRAKEMAEGRVVPHAWPPMVLRPGPEAVTALGRILAARERIGFDVESDGKDARRGKLTAIGVANTAVAVSLPWDEYSSGKFGHVNGLLSYPDGKLLRELLVEIMATERLTKIMHNGAYDKQVMRSRGIVLGGRLEDTLLLHRVIAENLKHDLQFVATCELPVAPWKSAFKSEDSASFVEVQQETLRQYNAQDAAIESPLLTALEASI